MPIGKSSLNRASKAAKEVKEAKPMVDLGAEAKETNNIVNKEIKVENDGYSKVATAAPDMENSTVIVPDAQTMKLVESFVKEQTAPIETESATLPAAEAQPKKRGRKPKAQPAEAQPAAEPKKRGRKPKAQPTEAQLAAEPKKRGRKPKVQPAKTKAATGTKQQGRKSKAQPETAEVQQSTYVNVGQDMPSFLL